MMPSIFTGDVGLDRGSPIRIIASLTIIAGALLTASGPMISCVISAGSAFTRPVLVTISSVSFTSGEMPSSPATSDASIVRLEPVSSQKL